LRHGAGWKLIWAGSHRNSEYQPNGTDGSNSRDSGNLNSGASINCSTWCDVKFRFIRSR
jgi:hypothetical protein